VLILLLTNEDILPELVNVYKSPFYLATRNLGGVDYAKRMKSYNPLFRMVARIFWYKIVHVGDFIRK